MKKSDLAGLTRAAQQLTETHEFCMEKLINIIESSFSALATAEPEYALQVLEQLGQQKEAIQNLLSERAENDEKFIELASNGMSDVLEFEDEN